MKRFYPLIIFIALFAIGFIRILISTYKIVKIKDFVIEFQNNFCEFANCLIQGNINGEKYQWLKLNSSKMQKLLNDYGVSCRYRPPFANFEINGYQVILNGISDLLNYYNQYQFSSFSDNVNVQARFIEDTLLTYLGELNSLHDEGIATSKNPVMWLREGVRAFILLPISFIYWTGLIQYRTYTSLSNNFLVKTVVFLVAVIGFISSIVTITTGYEPFLRIISTFQNTISK